MLDAAGLGLSAGGRELVRALDLSLAPGAFWSLLGRNGAGKTSLILALAGLRSPHAGTIALDGVALAAHRRSDLARRIAVLLQDEETDFWGSVLDYAMLGRYPRSRSAWSRDEEGAAAAGTGSPSSTSPIAALKPIARFPAGSASGRASRSSWCRMRTSSCSTSRCSIST